MKKVVAGVGLFWVGFLWLEEWQAHKRRSRFALFAEEQQHIIDELQERRLAQREADLIN